MLQQAIKNMMTDKWKFQSLSKETEVMKNQMEIWEWKKYSTWKNLSGCTQLKATQGRNDGGVIGKLQINRQKKQKLWHKSHIVYKN